MKKLPQPVVKKVFKGHRNSRTMVSVRGGRSQGQWSVGVVGGQRAVVSVSNMNTWDQSRLRNTGITFEDTFKLK